MNTSSVLYLFLKIYFFILCIIDNFAIYVIIMVWKLVFIPILIYNDAKDEYSFIRRTIMEDTIKMHNIDVATFTEIIAECEGDVYMVTPDGDKLNLKSKLCQLIGFTALIKGGTLAEASLVCENAADEKKLFRFNLFRNDAKK